MSQQDEGRSPAQRAYDAQLPHFQRYMVRYGWDTSKQYQAKLLLRLYFGLEEPPQDIRQLENELGHHVVRETRRRFAGSFYLRRTFTEPVEGTPGQTAGWFAEAYRTAEEFHQSNLKPGSGGSATPRRGT